MRIGLVLPAIPAYSETFFVNKIKGLQAHGHEVILFVHAKTGQSSFEGAKIKTSPKYGKSISGTVKALGQLLLVLGHVPAVLRFYRLERKGGIAALTILKRIAANSHLLSAQLDWLHFGFGTMALEKENIPGAIRAKMAVSFRGFDYYVYPVKNPGCYARLFSKTVTYHVLSEGMKKGLIAQGIPTANIVKITPAIDVSKFSANKAQPIQKQITITTVARLHWIKGLEYTLEALALLKQKGFSFRYTIVGDGPEKERLLFAAHQLGIGENVIFTGKITPDEVRRKLEESSLYLQYSIQEGFCNAVLEAQAMGKLCIVSDAEGLVENIVDGSTGYVVAKRNPVSLANKIAKVLSLTAEAQKEIAGNAADRIRKEFSIQVQLKQFARFYEGH
ncbi:glycosyltransferase family 4 protein [Flavobacterium humi]|uniref:Glycosyltransferase n=1 Tax=Flavobacterium humi TaxID=2562683 RepID=A0A4Z0L868_9FLAO|nr:glycosyltransferase family 4 protein [Flavobacterium humi]TGD57164.1 glycosyltransferase [Flavobacterium humi]